ncbi:MAG TPA: ROK family protein, partial [Candidatus Gracilibacteria bacterium]
MNHIIGLDIGGTKIYVANYDTELSLISDHQTPTESHKGAERIYQNILAAIKQVQTPEAKAVGIAWAGFVDKDGQTIRKGPNISGFEDFPLGQRLQKELGLPVVIGNDARLFALAECHTRTPISECLLGIILGTGVGSGLIIKGEIFKGAHNFAGEIGHIKPGTPQEIEDFIAGPGMTTFLQKTFPIKTLSDMEIYFQEDEVSPQ